ncbi:Anthranilate synthase component 1 [Candidatus Terasakiella magnetica]|uniref:Anthranilate synthase component 1 n=1 Tax=Candidatus Terasakiella magnetica TaxID=1867952 RepID=A0A1C3RCV8_9PROT|nr:anthranilate synthase component I [Candidatus Terasakiella magnetica]SCA55052.1 Anthranilate synthase component 1 [Candidatus Terasakiella magnetica]
MKTYPAFKDFEASYNKGEAQVVWTKQVADLETPVSAMMKLADGKPDSFLLESVEGGAKRGRYSFLGLKPDLTWRCFGQKAEINRKAGIDRDAFEPCDKESLNSLRALIDESSIDLPDHLPPMAAGLVGYMGYDTVRLMEKLPDSNPDPIGVPDGLFMRPTIIAAFDNIEDVVTIVTPVRVEQGVDAKNAYDGALDRLQEIVEDMQQSLRVNRNFNDDIGDLPQPVSNMSREQFHDMVHKAQEYILAGDIFQAVLSQRFTLPFELPHFSLYRSLRRLNPSPFLFFLNFGEFTLVGSSPEILVRQRDGEVTIRPIAGTRVRGADAAEDQALKEDLLSDPKELAEHLMLLDLGRNDVGRVAKIGTVKVTDQMIVELYSHVMHIVSNVVGELDSERFDNMDALVGGFPAGTVSGAPKVRAMEIIDELEPERRSFYAGCIGYFGANGDMDTAIALRTALLKDGKMYVQAGGGVVADSSPEGEYQESINKARALVRAAEEAYKFASDESSSN